MRKAMFLQIILFLGRNRIISIKFTFKEILLAQIQWNINFRLWFDYLLIDFNEELE